MANTDFDQYGGGYGTGAYGWGNNNPGMYGAGNYGYGPGAVGFGGYSPAGYGPLGGYGAGSYGNIGTSGYGPGFGGYGLAGGYGSGPGYGAGLGNWGTGAGFTPGAGLGGWGLGAGNLGLAGLGAGAYAPAAPGIGFGGWGTSITPGLGIGAGTLGLGGAGFAPGIGGWATPEDTETITEYWLIPGPATGLGPQGYQRSDERIKDDVHDRLTAHGRLDARGITVEVHQGNVTLHGMVDSRQAKHIAEDVAVSVPGVKDVQNQLMVQPARGPQQGQHGRQPPQGWERFAGISAPHGLHPTQQAEQRAWQAGSLH